MSRYFLYRSEYNIHCLMVLKLILHLYKSSSYIQGHQICQIAIILWQFNPFPHLRDPSAAATYMYGSVYESQ